MTTINKNEILLIGLGHKARQGKDFIAAEVAKANPEVHVIHWADELYKEVSNTSRKFPLITTAKPKAKSNLTLYLLLDKILPYGKPKYLVYNNFTLPEIHKIFLKRNISEYWGMNDKDGEMLQFWGTDFRRKTDPDYWVKKTADTIGKLSTKPYNVFLIADTRFKNEYDHVKDNHGLYVELIRLNSDGTRFIASDRDPNHYSETNLDNVLADLTITAYDGQFNILREYAQSITNVTESFLNGRLTRKNYCRYAKTT